MLLKPSLLTTRRGGSRTARPRITRHSTMKTSFPPIIPTQSLPPPRWRTGTHPLSCHSLARCHSERSEAASRNLSPRTRSFSRRGGSRTARPRITRHSTMTPPSPPVVPTQSLPPCRRGRDPSLPRHPLPLRCPRACGDPSLPRPAHICPPTYESSPAPVGASLVGALPP